jgi:hypothetical protein
VVEICALSLIAFVPMTYLATRLPLQHHVPPVYWVVVTGASLVTGVVLWMIGRRQLVDSLIAALVLVVALLSIDVLLGAPLQVNSVFGYSPTAGGRFAGVGNLAFAQLAAATILLAALLVHRIGGRRGVTVAACLLVGVVLLDGAPWWGADVGGVLALVPAGGVLILLFLGHKLRWRTFLAWAAAAVGIVALFGLLDLTRAEPNRTHLGRLFEAVGSDGLRPFQDVVTRKLGLNLGALTSPLTALFLPLLFGGACYLFWRAPSVFARIQEEVPAERAAMVGLAIAMVLGFALNDSGIAIPGVMMGVINASIVFLLLRTFDLPPATVASPDG